MNNDELLEKIGKLIDAKLEPMQKDMQNLRVEMQAGFQAVKIELIQKTSSYSSAALLREEDDSGIKRLSYVYTNTPELTARGRSPIHDGAAILRIITTPERSLQGEYWTNRKTTGTILLKFKSKKRLESFPGDLIAQPK